MSRLNCKVSSCSLVICGWKKKGKKRRKVFLFYLVGTGWGWSSYVCKSCAIKLSHLHVLFTLECNVSLESLLNSLWSVRRKREGDTVAGFMSGIPERDTQSTAPGPVPQSSRWSQTGDGPLTATAFVASSEMLRLLSGRVNWSAGASSGKCIV